MGEPTHPRHEANRAMKARLLARVVEDEGLDADAVEAFTDEDRRRVEVRTAELCGRDDGMRSSGATWALVPAILREREAAVAALRIAGGAEAFAVHSPR